MRDKLFHLRQGLLLVAFFSLVLAASAQTNGPSLGVVKGFRVPGDYFEPPFDEQMKSLIQGVEARPLGGNRFQITGLTLISFRTNGMEEMIVEAADCLFDNQSHTASSPRDLTVRSADRQFYLEGQGFQWTQDDSLLYISNSVHSVVHRGPAVAGQPVSTINGDLEIFSDHFTRDLKTGLSLYRDNVRVNGSNAVLTAGQMSLSLPMTNDIITLRDHATWTMDDRSGGGDELEIDRENSSLRSRGTSYVNMPGTSLSTTSSGSSSNKMVEVRSDRYELRKDITEFSGNVRVTQSEAGKETGKITCELMTVIIEAGNKIRSVVVETNVVVEQADGRFTGAMAKFLANSSMAEFSGQPTWSKCGRSGSGDILLVDQTRSEMTVRSNAVMRLPGSAFSRATNAIQTYTVVTSDDYTVKAGHAEFHGRAHIEDPKMKFTSDTLTADSPPGGTNIDRIVADKNVKAELADSNGKITHVTGDHALYTLDDGLLRLTGNPMVRNEQGWLTGSIIVWDRTYDLLIARNQRMVFQAPDSTTNSLPGLLNGN